MVLDDAPSLAPLLQAEPIPSGRAPSSCPPQSHRQRYLIVVARDQPDLWRHLRQSLTGLDGVDVVLDRRHGGRWQWTQSCDYQDRGGDRRRSTEVEASLSQRSVVIVQPAGSSPAKPPA